MRKNFMQTYYLIGMYRDLGAYLEFEIHRVQREKVAKKLRVRWIKGIDRDAFEQYFKDHHISKEELTCLHDT
jgi:hypothetical protein